MADEEDDQRRTFGMPVNKGDWRPRTDDTEQRVLGVPRSWYGPKREAPIDFRWVRHPIRWSRWRVQVHRLGPNALSYEDSVDSRATRGGKASTSAKSDPAR